MVKLCLDLCAGREGFSEAFKNNPNWEVIRVDIEERLKPDMALDLIDVVENRERYMDFWNLKPEVILASPPCERWSIANSHWPLPGIYTATKVLGAVLEIISEMRPRGWIIENPKGRMRWFLHKPSMTLNLKQFGYTTVKPTDFWTNIDFGLLRSTSQANPEGIKFSTSVCRAASKRALMPLGRSQMILDQMEALE